MKKAVANLAVVVVCAFGGMAAGACASWLGTYAEANDPKDDKKFQDCAVVARAEKQITGSGDKAEAAYFACTDDAGLPRPVAR